MTPQASTALQFAIIGLVTFGAAWAWAVYVAGPNLKHYDLVQQEDR